MAAYNEFDGLPCVANRTLLTELLRDQWRFDGIVMADGGAVERLVRLSGDPVAAGALALNAGCDLSLWDACYPRLAEAVARGLVTEQALNTAVARVLALKFRLGLFEEPYVRASAPRERRSGPSELSERMARASITLLANDGGVLPIAPSPRRIAVLGPNADSIAQQIGDYTAPQRPGSHHITVLGGIRSAAPPETEVTYAPGCELVGGDLSGVVEAAAPAAAADLAVLVLGGSSARSGDTRFDSNGAAVVTSADPVGMTCGEGVDLADLHHSRGQLALLLDAVAATGVPVVVVLVQGRPHALSDLPGTASAVLSAWYPGPWGGRAVADVLFGAAEPEGRLPVSVPRSAVQLPVFYNATPAGDRALLRPDAGGEAGDRAPELIALVTGVFPVRHSTMVAVAGPRPSSWPDQSCGAVSACASSAGSVIGCWCGLNRAQNEAADTRTMAHATRRVCMASTNPVANVSAVTRSYRLVVAGFRPLGGVGGL
jgi:beta-glucosidase